MICFVVVILAMLGNLVSISFLHLELKINTKKANFVLTIHPCSWEMLQKHSCTMPTNYVATRGINTLTPAGLLVEGYKMTIYRFLTEV